MKRETKQTLFNCQRTRMKQLSEMIKEAEEELKIIITKTHFRMSINAETSDGNVK